MQSVRAHNKPGLQVPEVSDVFDELQYGISLHALADGSDAGAYRARAHFRLQQFLLPPNRGVMGSQVMLENGLQGALGQYEHIGVGSGQGGKVQFGLQAVALVEGDAFDAVAPGKHFLQQIRLFQEFERAAMQGQGVTVQVHAVGAVDGEDFLDSELS